MNMFASQAFSRLLSRRRGRDATGEHLVEKRRDMAHIIGQKGKKYGLQIPAGRLAQQNRAKQQQKVLKPTLGIFAGADDDEDEDNIETQIAKHQRHAHSIAKNEEMYKQAIREDPTVFDYDAVYDSFRTNSDAAKKMDKTERKSKYIADLKAKAVVRQREQDMVYERKMVKDSKKEDHLYGDKEKFVTSSYRKKLEEEAKWVEEQRQKDEEERKNDVTKRKNLGDFYTNLLTKNVAFGTSKGETKEADVQERKEPIIETRNFEHGKVKSQSEETAIISPVQSDKVKVHRDHEINEGRRENVQRSDNVDKEVVPSIPFIPSSSFSGCKIGYVFKKGHRGLGYYSEDPAHIAALSKEERIAPKREEPKDAVTVKRNSKDAVEAARLRYLERKRKAAGMQT